MSISVGLPSWRTLIEHMGEELGFDAEIFANPETSYFTLAEYYRLQQGSRWANLRVIADTIYNPFGKSNLRTFRCG